MQTKINNTVQPVILRLHGDPLGEKDAFVLRQKVYELIERGTNNIVLDFHDVKHINSAGLGGLISSMTTLSKAEGGLRVACVNEHVLKVFSITRLAEIFQMYPTVEEACASFKA